MKTKDFFLNENYLDRTKGTIFVTSTNEDATAIFEALGIEKKKEKNIGYSITSLGSDSILPEGIKELADVADDLRKKHADKNEQYKPTFIILLNQDDVALGIPAMVEQNLERKNFNAQIGELGLQGKTIAESFENNAGQFVKELERVYSNPMNNFKKFLKFIDTPRPKPLATGFKPLDEALEGGLNSGLYVLGAMSSVGKSTFALQMSDYIARQGTPVLYFALEMSSEELIAKSLSRMSYFIGNTKFEKSGESLYKKYANQAQTKLPVARNILKGDWINQFPKEIYSCLMMASGSYADITSNMVIEPSALNRPKASDIRKKVGEYILRTNQRPMVVVDYLQLLTPEDDRATDKQNVTQAVNNLKQIALEFKIPVVVISSFNRSSYTNNYADMSAFKESGDIEYTADVVMSLGYDWEKIRVGDDKDDNSPTLLESMTRKENKMPSEQAIQIARKKAVRQIKLSVLKNRFGAIPDQINFLFTPKFDTFGALGKNGKPCVNWDEINDLRHSDFMIEKGTVKPKTKFEIENDIDVPF